MPGLPGAGMIVVTGTRLLSDQSSNEVELWMSYASTLGATAVDVFAQTGGAATATTIHFEYDGLDLLVTLPGYTIKFRLVGEDRLMMTGEQQGQFMKMMAEFRDSPHFTAILDKLQSLGVTEIPIRYDNVIHRADGTTIEWPGTNYERMSMAFTQGPNGEVQNLHVVLNINSNLVPGLDGVYDTWANSQGETVNIDFPLMFLHSMGHAFYVGMTEDMEIQVQHDADRMYDDIFNTSSSIERSPTDYISGQTFIGSQNNDSTVGSASSDTLSGLSGNDHLNGLSGDDLVLGGAGMDWLSGGTGNNLVMGGLDADTYAPASGVTLEYVSEIGGVDQIDLSRVSIQDVSFVRSNDSLIMYVSGSAVETIEIENQWLDSSRVEQFTFAEGTYAASYIESLAWGGGGGICYDGGFPVICGPYGMPVVLDLDGDGIELIDVSGSHARFDINGDGEWERIGWVGRDDGILALDRNGNGRIDEFSEISFLQDFLGAGSDLEGLYAYDSDGDGFLTAADDRFGDFLIWRDVNANGHSEPRELFTLAQLGIVSIGLERHDVSGLDLAASANQILGLANYRTADGRSHLVGDVALYAQMADCGCAAHNDLHATLLEVAVA